AYHIYHDKFDFASLISKWSLNTLLIANFPTDQPLEESLWTAMASLGELRNLYILRFHGYYATKRIPSVVLSRLSRLTITSACIANFDSILLRLGHNCTQLRFEWGSW